MAFSFRMTDLNSALKNCFFLETGLAWGSGCGIVLSRSRSSQSCRDEDQPVHYSAAREARNENGWHGSKHSLCWDTSVHSTHDEKRAP